MRLGLRHPDLLTQLPIGPALPAADSTAQAPDACTPWRSKAPWCADHASTAVPTAARPATPPSRHACSADATSSPSAPNTPPPERSARYSAPHPPPTQSRPLHHPHLRTRRAHNPLKLRAIHVADRHPPAHTLHGHHHPRSSPNMTRRSSRPAPTNPHLGANLQESPLAIAPRRSERLLRIRGRAAVQPAATRTALPPASRSHDTPIWAFRHACSGTNPCTWVGPAAGATRVVKIVPMGKSRGPAGAPARLLRLAQCGSLATGRERSYGVDLVAAGTRSSKRRVAWDVTSPLPRWSAMHTSRARRTDVSVGEWERVSGPEL